MGSGPRARVFFALMLGGELGERVMESTLAALGGEREARRGFRLPRPEGLHLTLLFLGDVEREVLAPLWQDVRQDPARAERPELVLDQAGAFPKRGRERVLWFGVREERHAGRLEGLVQRVRAAARKEGFDTSAEEGRAFRPHVTVARPRRVPPRVPDAFHELRPALEWRPAELALVESVRAEGGPPHYRPLEVLRLDP